MFELMTNKNYNRLFFIAIIVTLIATLSITSGLPGVTLINDKFVHGLMFFILAFLCFHSLQHHYGFVALLALSLFGLLIEVIQYYLPWRGFSWFDWLADNIGIMLYEVLHQIKRRYFLKQDH